MLNKKGKIVTGVAAMALSAVVFFSVPAALADLMIMPIRTVFQGHDRMKGLTLVNTSTKAAIFRMELYHLKQLPTGAYEALEGPTTPGYDLTKMIVYSPRQVELPPRGKQSVRLSLRRPADLPDGEYRMHIKMNRIASPNISAPKKGAAVGVGVNVGFSVPVMLRQGAYDAQAKIVDPKFIPAEGKRGPRIRLYIERTGKHSTLGRSDIFWTPPGGEERKIGELNGLNIYPEVSRREADVNISEQSLSGGKIRVVYEGMEADKGKRFDEKTFNVADLLR